MPLRIQDTSSSVRKFADNGLGYCFLGGETACLIEDHGVVGWGERVAEASLTKLSAYEIRGYAGLSIRKLGRLNLLISLYTRLFINTVQCTN
jgi:hypothetical protein